MTEAIYAPWGHRVLWVLVGSLFCLCFFGLGQTAVGLDVGIVPPFTNSTAGELNFWLGSILLLFPGCLMIGIGFAPMVSRLLFRINRRISQMSEKELWALTAIIFFLAVIGFRLFRILILGDFPVTDDEYSAQFGGQLLLGGHVAIPRPVGFDFFPQDYLFARGDNISCIDWPGIQIVWALDGLLGGSQLVFAAGAAGFIATMGYYGARTIGAMYGLLASLFALFSPMGFFLSLSAHAHIFSRVFVAIGLVAYSGTTKNSSARNWLIIGLAFGLGFLTRAIETAAIATPFVVDIMVRLTKRELKWSHLGAVLLGVLGPLVVFAVFNMVTTGNPLLPPRFAANEIQSSLVGTPMLQIFTDFDLLARRFGANLSYNLFMLSIYFMGPLGLFLVALGWNTNRLTKLLLAGVGCALLVALLHDNHGIHIVGPIHYAECLGPLLIIALHGAHNLFGRLRSLKLPTASATAAIGFAVVLGLGTFNAWHSRTLHQSVRAQQHVYTLVDALKGKDKIILAPQFVQLWKAFPPSLAGLGSYVFGWRRVHPYHLRHVEILLNRKGAAEEVRQYFPDREILIMRKDKHFPYFSLSKVIFSTASKFGPISNELPSDSSSVSP